MSLLSNFFGNLNILGKLKIPSNELILGKTDAPNGVADEGVLFFDTVGNKLKIRNETGNVITLGDATIADNTVTFAKIQDLAANKLIGAITSGDPIEITLTSAGRDIIDDANSADQRTTLGVVIGTDVEAFDAATVKDDEFTVYTAQQVFGVQELTDEAQIAWDGNLQQVAKLSIAANRTLLNITSTVDGGVYRLVVALNQTSNVLAFDSAYNFVGSVVPTMSNITHLTCIARGAKIDTIATEDFPA